MKIHQNKFQGSITFAFSTVPKSRQGGLCVDHDRILMLVRSELNKRFGLWMRQENYNLHSENKESGDSRISQFEPNI